jgi:hypothetical protein
MEHKVGDIVKIEVVARIETIGPSGCLVAVHGVEVPILYSQIKEEEQDDTRTTKTTHSKEGTTKK